MYPLSNEAIAVGRKPWSERRTKSKSIGAPDAISSYQEYRHVHKMCAEKQMEAVEVGVHREGTMGSILRLNQADGYL